MIIAGMNALVRRSCTWTPVRTLATTVKPGAGTPGAAKPAGSGHNNQPWRNRNHVPRKGDKSKPQAGPKAEPKVAKAEPKVTKAEPKVAKTEPKMAKTEPKMKKAEPRMKKGEPKAIPLLKTKPPPKIKLALKPTPKPERPITPSLTDKRAHIPLPSPNPPLSAYTLPPSKLRALIDLYHSSTSYLTPETLSDAIDDTFAPRRLTFNTSTRYQSYRDLVAQRDEMDAEPDRVVPSANELSGFGYGTADSLGGELMAGAWSASKGERARMVKAALWGVDPMARIGLETLLEAKVELDVQEKEKEQEEK
ncbi:unnamed protein product [Rhizoctonia solani]|uniref:Uncharacterized protein n=1 Tax=Rhizoctonia solani TaxID=456999 RepID=A0A8H2WV64_9AGAM|nr:unnamed protein product [Rhizoctonia solani]